MPVNVPNSRPNIIKTAVPMVLGAVGGAYGGPAGAMAGQKIGHSLVGGGSDPGAVTGKGGGSAMARRLELPDPQAQLAKAQESLAQLPPEEQQKYGPALTEAQKRAQQGGY